VKKVLRDGTVYERARFLRTTCKCCGRELSKEQINGNQKFCNKNCRTIFTRRHNKKYGLTKKQRFRLHDESLMEYGNGFSNETKHQGEQWH